MAHAGFLIAAVIVTAVAAIYDWRKGEFPQWLTLGTLGAAIIAHTVIGFLKGGFRYAGLTFGASILGAIACGLVPLLLYKLGGICGGDVKLVFALGALLGVRLGVEAELYGFVAGSIWALGRMAYEGKLLRTVGNSFALVFNPVLPKQRRKPMDNSMMTSMRFGPVLFVGTVVTVLTNWGAP